MCIRDRCNALRCAAPQAYLVLIDEAISGATGIRGIDAHLQPPLGWQVLAGLLEERRKAEDLVTAGEYKLWLSSRTLAGPSGVRQLSPMLCDLLACFMRHSGGY
jgi:hypothetical protein